MEKGRKGNFMWERELEINSASGSSCEYGFLGDGPASSTDLPGWMNSSTASGKPAEYKTKELLRLNRMDYQKQELGILNQDRL